MKCSYCNNIIIHENAIYCDQCGKFLNYRIQIEFNKDFIKTLNSLIDNVEKSKKGFDLNQKIDHTITLFWNILFKYSNMGKIINGDKITISDFYYTLPLNISYELKKTPKNKRFTEFIIQLNRYYKDYKYNLKKQEYDIYFLTNIKNEDINNDFSKILDLFDLTTINFDVFLEEILNFNSVNSKLIHNYKDVLLLKYTIKTKDYQYSYNQSVNIVYSLLGVMSLSENYNKYHKIISDTSFVSNYELSSFKVLSSFVIMDNMPDEYKRGLFFKINGLNTNLNQSKVQINSELIESYEKVDNPDISTKINEYLMLYYLASIETDLSTSFLKFWSLSERIIKDMSNTISDDKLIKHMENILILSGHPEYVYTQLKYIQEKRNEYVHKFRYDIINESDRNLIKLVSDKILGFLICTYDKISSFEDYCYILEYSNKKDEISRINDLLNK